jgi:excisionase family DNA binding protein
MLQNKTSISELFNTAYAAQYLGVTPKTLEVWRCTKRYNIPFIKVGRLVKYRKADLDAFLESRTVGAEA